MPRLLLATAAISRCDYFANSSVKQITCCVIRKPLFFPPGLLVCIKNKDLRNVGPKVWFIHPLNDATSWAKVVFPHLDVLVAAIGHDLQKRPDMHTFVAGLATMNRFPNCKNKWWILLYIVTCLDTSMKLPATIIKHVKLVLLIYNLMKIL